MQKWEYKTVLRGRGWGKDTSVKDAPWSVATEWNVKIEEIDKLGDEGWELVAISSRSSYLGAVPSNALHTRDYAGFTDQELWVFKRPKQ